MILFRSLRRVCVLGVIGLWIAATRAETRTFTLTGGAAVLEGKEATTEVVFQAFRPSRVGAFWNVDVVVRNRGAKPLQAPVVLSFEQLTNLPRVSNPSGVDNAGRPFLDLTSRLPAGGLAAGKDLPAFTVTFARVEGTPSATAVLFGTPDPTPLPLAVVTRTLDEAGLPLPGVRSGDATSERGGWITLPASSAGALLRFEAPGRLPTFRFQPMGAGVLELPTPRLARRNGSSQQSGDVTVTVTSLDAQTLTAPLPIGWNPVAAAFVEFITEPATAAPIELALPPGIPAGTPLVLAEFDAAKGAWFARQALKSSGSASVPINVPRSGGYALAFPDANLLPPPDGTALPPSTTPVPPANSLTATGSVTPPQRLASTQASLVTAQARVVFRSSASPLPGGTWLRCRIQEEYRMRDGSRRVPPVYEADIVGHRSVAAPESGVLAAEFPLRPLLLLSGDELAEALVRVEVLSPNSFEGEVISPAGGELANGAIRLTMPSGGVSRNQAAQLRERLPSDFADLATGGQNVVAAFELGLAGVLDGKALSLRVPIVAPNSRFVLARTVFTEGLYGLQPVGRFASDAAGALGSIEPDSGDHLRGIDGGGQYVLLAASAPSALVQGVARDRTGQPAAGLAVRSGPWLAFTDADGRYRLLAPAGTAAVSVIDPRNGDTGTATTTIAANLAAVTANLDTAARGPRVLSSSPANDATSVARVSAITLAFDKPLNPATVLGDAVQFNDATGAAVPSSRALNLARTSLTLLPATQLAANTRFTVSLAPTVADTSGLPLEGPREFHFTTESDSLRRADATLVIHEPVGGLAPMVGGPGLAEPESPVILVNETTGFTSTVLSKPDGSFTNNVPADVEDELAVVIVNKNGSRNRVTPSRQVFLDESVGLFGAGGQVSAPGEGGDFSLALEPGSSRGRTVIKLSPVPLARATNQTPASPVFSGIAAAMDVRISGDEATGPARLSVPFDPVRFAVPAGTSPTNMTFALAIARVVDGEVAYQVVDRMQFVNGRLECAGVTPFAGWLDGLKQDPNPLVDPTQFPAARAGLAGAGRGQAKPEFALVFAAAEIARMVVMYALDPPLVLTGKVGLCPLQVEGACLEEQFDPFFGAVNLLAGQTGAADFVTDALQQTLDQATSNGRLAIPGAVVDAALSATGKPTRFTAGLPYGVTDRGGSYRFLLPAAKEVYLARARHPSHPEPKFQPVAPLFESFFIAPAVKKNFTFVPDTGLNLPPVVTVSQTPMFPRVGETARVRLDVVHATAASATVSAVLELVSPLPGETPVPTPGTADVTRSQPALVPGFGGPSQKRFEFTVQGGKPLVAHFKITTSVQPASTPLITTTRWSVDFGSVPSPANLPLKSDDLDKVGPTLVRTEPAQGGTLPAGQPIRLVFNEPIDAGISSNSLAFTLTPTAPGGLNVRLSADQTLLELFPPTLEPATAYNLDLQAPIKDLAGNPLQGGTLSGLNLKLRFRTPSIAAGTLPGIQDGGGAVVHENQVYALDRAGDGRLLVFDASTPTQPVKIAEVPLPGFPRDLEFIPDWSYFVRPPQLDPGSTPRTHRNLLLIVGGATGVRDPSLLNFDFQRQYLRVYDVTDPSNPTRIASSEITQRPAAVQKVTWHPPEAAFFENGADFQQVAVLDLQAYILAYNLSLSERQSFLFDSFRPGDDGSGIVNGLRDTRPNGHYTDAGDKLPVPERVPIDFFGRRFNLTLRASDGGRRILDYAYDNRFGYGALVFSGGPVLNAQGEPTGQQLPPGYRTAYFNGDLLTPTATVTYGPNARPKRVHLEFQVDVSPNGTNDLRNLAFVSLAPDDDGKPKLHVIDVTDPVKPSTNAPIDLPAGLGLPQSVYRLPDGTLALAMTSDALVIDPRLALLPSPASGPHPMFRNRIPSGGSGNQTLNVSRVGILAPNLGSRHEVVQVEPRLRIVQFRPNDVLTNALTAPLAGTNVLLPTDIRGQPDKLAGLFAALQEVASVHPASIKALGSNTPSLLPPTRPGHYHLVLEAPGGAGAVVNLGLQSLNRAGLPLKNKGRDFPAVRAAGANAASAIKQTPREGCDAPFRELRAQRLSDDPADPFYNTYLSEPFALVVERTTLGQLATIQAALPRAVLWSGFGLSAFIDPSMDLNPVLGPFAARATGFAGDGNDLAIQPRTEARAETSPGTYIPGSNPPPANGHEDLPGTFGMVNAHNGEIRSETTDISLPGRGLPIVFERTIGGQDLYEGPFGRGWDFTYNQQIVPLRPQTFGSKSELPYVVAALTNSNGGVTPLARSGDLVLADGAGHLIPYVNAGTTPPPEIASDPLVDSLHWKDRTRTYYLPSTNAPGVFDPVFEFQDGAFARLTPDGTQFWYDRTGRLTTIYDRHPANYQELQYNERGELVRIIDQAIPDGARHLRIGYYRMQADNFFLGDIDVRTDNAFIAGKIARLKDYTGRAVDFEYDADGFLFRRRGVAGSPANEGSGERPVVTYLWSGCDGQMGGVTAGGGSADQDSALFATTVDPATSRVQGSGNGVGGTVALAFPATLQSKVTGPDQAVTEFQFDKRGYPIERRESGPGNDTALTTFAYNQHGLLTNQVDALGGRTSYTYDSDNQTLRARANLLRIERQPGSRGGATIVHRTPGFDLRYNLPTGDATDANGHVHTTSLSADGRVIDSIRHVGAGQTVYQHNEFGQVEKITSPDGVVTGYEYDSATGFPKLQRRGQNEYQLGYDSTVAAKHGRPTSITPPRGAATTIQYNDRLQPIEIHRGQFVAKMGYDANGNQVYSERKVDATQRLIQRWKYNRINFLEQSSVDGVDVNGTSTVLVTTNKSSAADAWRVRDIVYPGGQVRHFDYDHLGHVQRITLGTYVEDYKRDVHGNVLELRRGGTLTQSFAYDGHDRPTNSIAFRSGQATERVDTSYFPGGELAQQVVTDSEFGELSNLKVEEIDALGRPRKQTRKGTQSDAPTTFTYPVDASGGGMVADGPRDRIESHHDAAGYPKSLSHALASITYTPDGNGNITGVSSDEGARTYSTTSRYDDLDHLFEVLDDLGTQTTFEPRLDGAPAAIIDARSHRTRQDFTVLGELLQQTRPHGIQTNLRRDRNRQLTLAGDVALKGHETAYDTGTFRPTEFRLRSSASFLAEQPNGLNLPGKVLMPGGKIDLGYDLQGRTTSSAAEYAQGEPYRLNAAYDALGRLRTSIYGSTGQYQASFQYDLLGPLTEATFVESHGTFSIGATLYPDGSRETLHYPSTLVATEDRDAGGRLLGVREAGGDLYRVRQHAGALEREVVELAGGAILETTRFDLRRRVAARTFARKSDNRVLADVRYRYDATDNVVARQEVHRHGRTDVFGYDDANRLVRLDQGLRPDLRNAVRHNAAGLNASFGLVAGRYARDYVYDSQGFDLLEKVNTVNPDPLVVSPIPFVGSLQNPDAFLFPRIIDGVALGGPDPLGNSISNQLLIATGGGLMQRVPARLRYSADSQLARVERADGVTIEYEHQPGGLIHRRRVTGPGSASDVALVWDQGRLVEEYERAGGTNRLRARYLYADEDSPFAADLADTTGQLRRHWYLRDALGSVMALVDGTSGEVVERVQYDAWGQPVIEGRDTRPPQVAFVAPSVNGEFILQFSEPVFPNIQAPPAPTIPGPDGALFTGQAEIPAGSIKLVTSGGPVPVGLVFEEDLPTGFAFGQVLRVRPQPTANTILGLEISAGFLVDEWGNPNIAETLIFQVPAAGQPLYQAPAGRQDTRPPILARSALGSPMLFHGQFWDADAGLLYLRARFYDPSLGLFLQLDPLPYSDSPNQFAAFGNNPTSYRDPRGTTTKRPGGSIDDVFASSPRSPSGAKHGHSPSPHSTRRPPRTDQPPDTVVGPIHEEVGIDPKLRAMAQAEDLAQRPRQRIRPAEPYLENLFGEARPPTFIRTKNGEGLSAPPGLQKVRFGEEVQLRPYKTADGNHGKYLWVVDKEGNLLVAPESPAGASRVTKHTDVTQRGAGRVGGEFIYSDATDSWAINIDSGRYSATYTSEARAAAQAFGMSLQDTVEKLERKMPGLLITDRQNVHADNVVRNFRFGNEVITLTE